MTDEQRAARLARARFWIRVELAIAASAIAASAVVIAGFLWISQPGCMCPMAVVTEPSLAERLPGLAWIGVAIGGLIVGFAAMLRLSRPDPERGERSWRYRR